MASDGHLLCDTVSVSHFHCLSGSGIKCLPTSAERWPSVTETQLSISYNINKEWKGCQLPSRKDTAVCAVVLDRDHGK